VEDGPYASVPVGAFPPEQPSYDDAEELARRAERASGPARVRRAIRFTERLEGHCWRTPRKGVHMATAEETGIRMERTGESIAGRHDETKWALLTTEFWAMLGLIVAVLIAAAVSDSLDDVRAWTLVTIIGAAYIVSRGIAKSGTDHDAPSRRGRR
jgi:hypothetical protein